MHTTLPIGRSSASAFVNRVPKGLVSSSQVAPLLWPGIVAVATNGINYWLVSIGLASREQRVCAHWTFAIGIVVAGVALFWLLF